MNNQDSAFEKLSKLKVGALFMEMGTGKTKVALDLIASKKKKIDYVLWICPFSTKGEIESERLKWHPELKMEIIGCETISQSDRTYIKLLEKVKIHRSFVVVDESLKIKNIQAKRTKRILEFGKLAKYKLILNGTPLSKNVLDLYPQMKFLSPKILDMTFNQFKDSYCEYYVRGKLKNKVKKQYNIPHLVAKIRPYIFDSELDLGKSKHYHFKEYEIENREEYEGIKRNFINFDNNDISFFALATSLQKNYCTSELRKTVLEEVLSGIEGQVIVFVKYIDSIPKDEKRVIGDMNEKERKDVIEQFKKNKFKTLYMTYGCGSFGLNMQNCKNIVFADHTFDYAQRLQAEARIYRLGQESDVDYYNLECNCGLERLILSCLDKKVRLLDEIKNEIERNGKEEWLKTI